MTSIIIPAYNEGTTISRCLNSFLADAKVGEFKVIVVCNGCKDDTAERAREYEARGVTVIETEIGSKILALNLGDEAATSFPRIYLDADITLTAKAIRDLAELLADEANSDIVLAAPKAVVDYESRNPWVRAYYKVWTQLPYFTEGIIGSGVYAFSKKGRERFGKFPDIIADDEFARLQALPHERTNTTSSTFTITPPASLRGIIHINTRARAGLYELQEKFPELIASDNTSPTRTLKIIATSPSMWIYAPIYLFAMVYAKLRAHEKLKNKKHGEWERDESSRTVVDSKESP
ncbi:MAG: glycosyltransferase involved in cell wall biosynthesis [Cellvibrionaceae bacterium]|jgi:glycosyltransferase involved in cell wall biosynthesis